MTSVLTVIVKDDEKTLRSKFLMYDAYAVDDSDPKVQECIAKTLAEFKGEPTDINVKIQLCVR